MKPDRLATAIGLVRRFWDDLTFAMPWLPDNVRASDVGVTSIDDWLTALDAFKQQGVSAWKHLNDEGGGCSKDVWNYTGVDSGVGVGLHDRSSSSPAAAAAISASASISS